MKCFLWLSFERLNSVKWKNTLMTHESKFVRYCLIMFGINDTSNILQLVLKLYLDSCQICKKWLYPQDQVVRRLQVFRAYDELTISLNFQTIAVALQSCLQNIILEILFFCVTFWSHMWLKLLIIQYLHF